MKVREERRREGPAHRRLLDLAVVDAEDSQRAEDGRAEESAFGSSRHSVCGPEEGDAVGGQESGSLLPSARTRKTLMRLAHSTYDQQTRKKSLLQRRQISCMSETSMTFIAGRRARLLCAQGTMFVGTLHEFRTKDSGQRGDTTEGD